MPVVGGPSSLRIPGPTPGVRTPKGGMDSYRNKSPGSFQARWPELRCGADPGHVTTTVCVVALPQSVGTEKPLDWSLTSAWRQGGSSSTIFSTHFGGRCKWGGVLSKGAGSLVHPLRTPFFIPLPRGCMQNSARNLGWGCSKIPPQAMFGSCGPCLGSTGSPGTTAVVQPTCQPGWPREGSRKCCVRISVASGGLHSSHLACFEFSYRETSGNAWAPTIRPCHRIGLG